MTVRHSLRVRPGARWVAVASIALVAAITRAAPPGVIALESPPCVEVDGLVVVSIAVGVQAQPWVGGQALLAYDTDHLFLVGPQSGDPIFDLPIYFASNPSLGTIDVAAGISPGGGDTLGGVTLAKLVFLAVETPDPCPLDELVWFRDDRNFDTLLSMDDGTPVVAALEALGPLSITDGPSITPPPDIVWSLPLSSACVSDVSPGFATGSAECGAAPTITWVRSDGGATLDEVYAFIDSPITITWTATDDCGFTASADQTIELEGCLGDLNGDLIVNGADISVVLGFWATSRDYIGDLNCDGTVDGADITILLGQWGPCP